MQEQIQQEKILSFEDICPDFSQLIAEHGWDGVQTLKFKADDGKVRNISDAACCVVGEAHGN